MTAEPPRPADDAPHRRTDDAARRPTAAAPRRRSLVLLAVVSLPLFFAGLGAPSLWEPDEPRFAEASREMLVRGDYLTPWFNDEPRFEKPILIYWMQLALYALMGVSELSARLPVALTGLASVLLVYLLGVRLVGERAGLIGALAFATMFRIVVYARHGLTDMPLLMFLLATMYFFWCALDDTGDAGAGSGAGDAERSDSGRSVADPDAAGARRCALLGWASLGLAMATKGPVALVILLVWGCYLVISGQRRRWRRLHPLPGLALFALIGLPWYVYMIWRHGRTYLDTALLNEIFNRVVEPEFQGEVRGFFYFFKVWPADIAPWTLFFLAAVAGVLVSWRRLDAEARRASLLLLTWFVVIQVFFSFISGKLPHYVIPSYPAVGLLIGLAFERVAATRAVAERFPMAVAGWATIALCVIAGLLLAGFLFRVFDAPLVGFSTLLPVAVIGGAIAALVAQWRGRPVRVFASLAAAFTIAYTVLAVHTVPRYLEPFKPIRDLSAEVARQWRPGDRLCSYPGIDAQSFVFYTRAALEAVTEGPGLARAGDPGADDGSVRGGQVSAGVTVEKPTTPSQVRVMLAGSERVFCLMRAEDFAVIRRGLPFPVHVVGEGPLFFVRLDHLIDEEPDLGRRRAVVISNRPAE